MSIGDFQFMLFLTAVSILSAGLIVAVLHHWFGPRRAAARALLREAGDGIVFLFDQETLADATPAARRLIRARGSRGSDWDALVSVLGPRFPDLRQRIGSIAGDGTARIEGTDAKSAIKAECWGGLLRLRLIDDAEETVLHPLTVSAIEDELETLRAIGEDAPLPIWKEDTNGQVVWANRAYLQIADRLRQGPAEWPPARLFPELSPNPGPETPMMQRLPATLPDADSPIWFEVTSLARGGGMMHFASDVSALVSAEQAGRKFVQTLTKTFAQLSIGLAIFNRDRQLFVFNPALLDLTGLPASFLSARPGIHAFLDRLRDRNMLPEPKNYKNWRDQVSALETAAAQGTYCETWTLPGGQTYRVTGRPHPDGAIAFLFEDISAEVSLTRHFRAELDTAQSVLDSLDEAIAVFSPAGTLTMSNAAFAQDWGTTAEGLAESAIHDEIRRWRTRCAPTPVWDELRDACDLISGREPWSENVRMLDGRGFACRFLPLPGGASLIGFRRQMVEVGAAANRPEQTEAAADQGVSRRKAVGSGI